MKLINKTKSLLIAVCILSFLPACEKDDTSPDYVGSWIATGIIDFNDEILEYRDVMTFTESSFNTIGQMKDPETNEWLDFVGMKGSISVSENIMSTVVEEVGMTSFDILTGDPTGTIIYYTENQSGFSTLLTQIGMQSSFDAEYSVSENNLTLKTDNNVDGDYDDAGEITIYTKQSGK